MKLSTDVPYYLELQRRMLDIFRYVSCHERNFGAHSIMIESLLVDACSFFDSLCQTMIREQSATGCVFKKQASVDEFKKKVDAGKNFTIVDYHSLLEADLVLSGKGVNLNSYEDDLYVNPLDYHPDQVAGFVIVPFKAWAAAEYVQLPWWKAFTELKHDRLANLRQSTLENVIDSLAAAFIMLTLRHENSFKSGHVPAETYNLFFPKYWSFSGRLMPGIVTWS